jgi:hypothetical protein
MGILHYGLSAASTDAIGGATNLDLLFAISLYVESKLKR